MGETQESGCLFGAGRYRITGLIAAVATAIARCAAGTPPDQWLEV